MACRRLIKADRLLEAGKSILLSSAIFDDFPVSPINNIWDDTSAGSTDDKVYVVQTSTKVIERCILMTTDPGDLVLDPTCGSGTTAYVAEQWGRRWITIDTSRVALALARARIMGARYPYYLLADSPRGPAQGSRSHPHRAFRQPDPRQHPPRLRLRARAAHHAQVHRQQRRDRRHLGPVPGDAGAAARAAEHRARARPGRSGRSPARPMPSGRTRRRSCTPTGGKPASPGSRRSTPPSPPRPSSNTSTTSPTRTRRRSASPVPSPSRASRPTACWASTRTTS